MLQQYLFATIKPIFSALTLLAQEAKQVQPDDFNNPTSIIIITLITSLIAALLAGIILAFLSKKVRWLITRIFGIFTHSDIEFVYDTKEDAKSDITEQLKKSKKVYILTSRGNELQRFPFKELISEMPKNRATDFRIVLPDTSITNSKSYTDQREEELGSFDKSFGSGSLKRSISANVEYLKDVYKNDNECGLKLRLANFPHSFRLIITDDYLYFQPYDKNRHGVDDPIIKYRHGYTYKAFARHFDLIWNLATDELN